MYEINELEEGTTLAQLARRTNIRLLDWYDKDYCSAHDLHEHLLSLPVREISREDLKLLSALLYASDMYLTEKIRIAKDYYELWLGQSIVDNSPNEPLINIQNDVVEQINEYVRGRITVDMLYRVRFKLSAIRKEIADRFGEQVFGFNERHPLNIQRILDAYELANLLLGFAVFLRAEQWQKFWAFIGYDRDGTRANLLQAYGWLCGIKNLFKERKRNEEALQES